jgi:hypothetical protein
MGPTSATPLSYPGKDEMDSPLTPIQAEPTQRTSSRATTVTALMVGVGTFLAGCAAVINPLVGVQAYAKDCLAPTPYSSEVQQPTPPGTALAGP